MIDGCSEDFEGRFPSFFPLDASKPSPYGDPSLSWLWTTWVVKFEECTKNRALILVKSCIRLKLRACRFYHFAVHNYWQRPSYSHYPALQLGTAKHSDCFPQWFGVPHTKVSTHSMKGHSWEVKLLICQPRSKDQFSDFLFSCNWL